MAVQNCTTTLLHNTDMFDPSRIGSMLNAEEGLRPLTALVKVVVPHTQCIFTSLLNTWYLVKDRQSKPFCKSV